MIEQIQEVYQLGLEKYAGDETAAKEFVTGFMKEAFFGNPNLTSAVAKGVGGAIGGGLTGLGLGLAMHGVSSAMNAAAGMNLRKNFEASLSKVKASNALLEDADPTKVNGYAETIFKFAPHVACDPNLLSTVMGHIIQGEGVDTTIMKTLVELEAKIMESRKNSMFSPKTYI